MQRSDPGASSQQNSGPQQIKFRPPIHLPLEQLDSRHVAFHLIIGSGGGHGTQNRRQIFPDALGKPFQLHDHTRLRLNQPAVQALGGILRPMAQQVSEFLNEGVHHPAGLHRFMQCRQPLLIACLQPVRGLNEDPGALLGGIPCERRDSGHCPLSLLILDGGQETPQAQPAQEFIDPVG